MKKTIPLMLLIIFTGSSASAQNAEEKKDPVGDWKFETTYSPEGYASGTLNVSFADKKYSAYMSVTGSDYKFPGEKVRFENDSLLFTLYVEDETVIFSLKLVEFAKMSGKAVYSGGEIPLTFNRENKESQQK